MARLSRLFLCLALAGSSVSACSDPPEPVDPPAPGYTGLFVLARVVTFVPAEPPSVFIFAEARFHESAEADALSLDAGDTTGLTRDPSAIQIELIRRNFLGDIFYQRDPDGDPLPETDYEYEAVYDLAGSGSGVDGGVPPFALGDVLVTPGDLNVTSPDITQRLMLDGTADVVLQWTGTGPAADRAQAIISVSDGVSGSATSIASADDGTLTIPAATFQQLGDGDGSITLYRINERAFGLPAEGDGTARALTGVTGLITVTLP